MAEDIDINQPRNAEAEAVAAAVLEGIRAGVRQRQAEVAALADGGEGAKAVDLQIRGRLEEPVAVSAVPGIGPLVVLARKIFLKAFGRWYSRPLILQQTHFNQSIAQHFAAQATAQERLQRRVYALEETLREQAAAHGPTEPES
jgi:hypothetical protein